MAPNHAGLDEPVSGRRRKPSRSPELSSPRPSKRRETHRLSFSAYHGGALSIGDSYRPHGQSNRLPWNRQGESSRHRADNMANAPGRMTNCKLGKQRRLRRFDSDL